MTKIYNGKNYTVEKVLTRNSDFQILACRSKGGVLVRLKEWLDDGIIEFKGIIKTNQPA